MKLKNVDFSKLHYGKHDKIRARKMCLKYVCLLNMAIRSCLYFGFIIVFLPWKVLINDFRKYIMRNEIMQKKMER